MILILYHFTDISSLIDIINTNIMISTNLLTIELKDYFFKPFISFTRNKNFIWRGNCRILLNKDLLKYNYKIKPLDFFGKLNNDAKLLYLKNSIIEIDQMEEIVITSKIKNIKKYIISIDFYNLQDIKFDINILKNIKFDINKIRLFKDFFKTKIL